MKSFLNYTVLALAAAGSVLAAPRVNEETLEIFPRQANSNSAAVPNLSNVPAESVTASAVVATSTPVANTDAQAKAKGYGTLCCLYLTVARPSLVSYPSMSSYNASMEGFWTLQATFDTPSCVYTPKSAADVSVAVKVLSFAQCRFSIKGGGHTPWKGAASITYGVQIDMTSMNNVTVNSAKTQASIGSGARWGHIYGILQSQGMMVSGGRDSDVGVGGLVLGGGYSWFTSKLGFVADAVLNIELVKADGTIINVNKNSNADLFVGLKGGGNNFGIVTRYDLIAFPFGTMWGGLKIYSNTTTDLQIAAFVNFTDNAYTDPKANLINYYSYSSSDEQHIVFNVIDYTEPTPNPPIYDQINAIPGVIGDTTRVAQLSSYTDELSSTAQRNRNIFLTLTIDNNAAMYRSAVDISNSYLKPFLKLPNFTWSLLFQPIPRVVSDNSLKTGGNIMGVDRNKGNLILYLLYITWSDPAYDAALNKAAYATLDEIKAKSVATGTSNPYIYLNYAGEFQDPLGGYGKANVAKMAALSKKYDPNGVFQKLVPGGFKIANAKPTTP